MAAASKTDEAALRELALAAVDRLLDLRLTHDLLEHRIEDGRSRWRELTEQLHAAKYPITGAGVIATRENLGSPKIGAENGGFLHAEELLAPEDVVSNLGSYPLAAASSAYAFSIVEIFGNEVARMVRPDQKTYATWSWHKDVTLDPDDYTERQGMKALRDFAAPFGADFLKVQPASVWRLVAVRGARNDYIHRRIADIDFHTYVGFCLALVCQIFFLAVPGAEELKRYPWTHYDEEKWGPN